MFQGELNYLGAIRVLFGPVKPELGVIPSGQENHSRAEHYSILFYLSIGSEEVLSYFPSCFWFTPETQNRMEINL